MTISLKQWQILRDLVRANSDPHTVKFTEAENAITSLAKDSIEPPPGMTQYNLTDRRNGVVIYEDDSTGHTVLIGEDKFRENPEGRCPPFIWANIIIPDMI